MRVIVVGAGMAGLTCASELQQAGIDVSVVEARDRTGGRLWQGEIDGTRVDLGGSWLHGTQDNPLADWCALQGIDWASDGAWGTLMQVHNADGSLAGHPAVTSLVAAWADFDPAEAVAGLGGEATLSEAIDWYLKNRNLTGEPGDAVRFSLEWLEGGLNIGAHPDAISATGAAAYVLPGGANVVINGGYQTVVDRLSAALDIQLEEPVLAVEVDDRQVIVSTKARSLQADRVVMTVPLGVLRSGQIQFVPGLPLGIDRAVNRLRMSTAEKLILRYAERWWPENVRRLVYLGSDHRFPAWMDLTTHVGAPTLLAYHNPRLSDVSPDPATRMEQGVEVLARMLGKGPKPTGAMVTDWTNDPYARGSYSHIAVGATPGDMRAFQNGERRVLFAGEHTVPEYHGTAHAAFVSGLRAARQILES
jgi:polyamine oxidase